MQNGLTNLVPIWSFLLSFTACITPNLAVAAEYPTTFQVYSEQEHDMLSVDCTPASDGQLMCSFVETNVRKHEPELITDAKVDEAMDSLSSNKEKNCGQLSELRRTMKESLDSGVVPKGGDQKTFDKLLSNPRYKDDVMKSVGALELLCMESPTRQHIIDFMKYQNDKKERTCSVWSTHWEGVFERQSGGQTWVRSTKPSGICGVIRISVIEKDQESDYDFWNYRTKKVVTNKNEDAFLVKCSELDETEYTYTWKRPELFLGCDYINFGMF